MVIPKKLRPRVLEELHRGPSRGGPHEAVGA